MERPDPAANDPRLAAATDLLVATVRETSGLHTYDGVVQDLSPSGVAAGLARLGVGEPPGDPHDAAHLAAVETGLGLQFGTFEAHRTNPYLHVEGLDLACYDRDYAPAGQRALARARHLAAWPDAVDAAVASLDSVRAPVARALLPAARGLSEGVATGPGGQDGGQDVGQDVVERALAAHARLVAHLEAAAEHGDPDPAAGGAAVAAALGGFDGLDVDLGALAVRADAERDRLAALLRDAVARLAPGEPVAVVVERLLADHPDAGGVLDEARALTREVLDFTRDHDLAPFTDGECLVEPAPPSRSWAMAMMAWAAPEEDDAPSLYQVTPPDPSWPAQDVEDWLKVFSRTTLPAITVHEVAPGHYTHGRAMRHLTSPVRRRLLLPGFAEGWAHYVEELLADLGFRADDPRYVVGMCLEALVRVTRLRVSIGLHTGAMTLDEATAAFEQDAYLAGPSARSEAARGTFDLGYGCYTLGKLAIRDLGDQARAQWGDQFSLARFHTNLLALGSPPLALLPAALH